MKHEYIHLYYCTNNSTTADVHGPIEIKCDTQCPGGVNVSESTSNGQYGLTLLKKMPQPQHTRMNIGGGMGRKIGFGKTNN